MIEVKKGQEVKDDQGKEVSAEELEKSLEMALQNLAKAKTKPVKEPEDEEDEEDEDEEDEDEGEGWKSEREPDFEALSKSLEESVASEDQEASEVIDGIPFVKALVNSLEEQIVELVKAIIYLSDKVENVEKKVSKVGTRLEKSVEVNEIQAQLVKSVSETVRKIGEAPLPRKAAITQLEIMKKSDTGEEHKVALSKSEALEKVTELHREGRLTLAEVISTEARIQKGMEIPENVRNLLEK